MYLKTITMQGFKSFANKIDLEFHDGITGIVGPNGSGKSNVADAVRWVLGEQSAKQLRGGNMQDVIFAGTESRKALGFASVSICFENADRALKFDADEVTVARKLYRSGESEYLLNGHHCRLKDIQELFYDTGIGKEGYSIIGQGQIDKILSGKPDERRELFDEAAGIVKYKRRKDASVRKLQNEEQNLVRVTDILKELTRQVGPLADQAEKAETYLHLRDELKDAEVHLFCTDSLRLEEKQAETQKSLDVALAHQSDLNEAYEQSRREYSRIEAAIEALEQTLQELRERRSAVQEEKNRLDNRISLLAEQIRFSGENREEYKSRVEALKRDRDTAEEQLAAQEKSAEALEKEHIALEQARKEKEAALENKRREILELEQSTEADRNQTIRILNQRVLIREKLQRYETMLESSESRLSSVAETSAEQTQEIGRLSDTVSEARKRCSRIEEQIDGHRNALSERQDELDRLLAEQKDTERKLEEASRNYHRVSARLESLRNLAERYEGYGNSVRRVMSLKNREPGIHGVVADLLQTKKEYETAIEIALGGSLQNIVTDDEQTAKRLIGYLKQNRYGRATFLPLTAMRSRNGWKERQVLSEPGVLGVASDLVICDKAYRVLAERLLGSTIVVDQMDHAIAAARKYHHSIRMVTLEGELLNPGGAMTGGAYRSGSSLLGRKRELRDLQEQSEQQNRMQEALAKRAGEIRSSRQRTQGAVQKETGILQRLYLEQNTASMELKTTLEKVQTASEDKERYSRENRELKEQIRTLQEQIAAGSRELAESESEEEKLQALVTKRSEKLEEAERSGEQLRSETEEARLEAENSRQKSDFLRQQADSTRKEIRRLEEEAGALIRQISSGEEEHGERQKTMSGLKQQLEAAAESFADLEKEIAETAGKREEMNRSHKTFFDERDRLSEERSAMDKECFRLNARLEKIQEDYDGMVDHLWETYQLTPDEARQLNRDSGENTAGTRARVLDLKHRIRELGNVNVNAVEEYKELKERYDFLSAQYEDIQKAAGTLKGIIRQLDESMRKQFTARFEEIRTEYNQVFRELFGGGKATLELVEDADVLDAGIVINAQPPGKKLQNMMQLSGGEKALGAIALLFAIQNLKPSPFCLLDEIEAALDDTNVDRYAEYLNKLKINTQFIVITHRRGTMAACDRLYGITMQEKGISTLVSVDLIDEELEA